MNLTQLIDIKEKIAIGAELTQAQRNFVLDCINEATSQSIRAARAANALAMAMGEVMGGTAVASSPPSYLGRIDFIWAFLSIDDGGEGVCAAPLGEGMLTVPMIAADKKRLDSLKPLAQKLPDIFGKPVRLAKFGAREDVEIYHPTTSVG